MRDRKRLFVSINLPQSARGFFQEFRDRWYDFPARWVDSDLLHITLSFLGNVSQENVPEVICAIEDVTKRHNPFVLKIEKLGFDTRHKKSAAPRMIQAKVGESENLQKLCSDISNALLDLSFSIHSQRPRITPHITLCRFNSMTLARWHGDELPEVTEEADISFNVQDIHLMESKLKRGGPEHFVLQSFALGERMG